MATIVTMGSSESSTVVISPSSASAAAFRSSAHDNDLSLLFCLDSATAQQGGGRPAISTAHDRRHLDERREIHPASEGMVPVKKLGSDSTGATEVSDDSPLRVREKTSDPPQQIPSQAKQQLEHDAKANGKDEKTQEQPKPCNSSSPFLQSNDLTNSVYGHKQQQFDSRNSPLPQQRTDRSDSIVSMQDMYDDGGGDTTHNDEEEDDDFYSNQQQGPYMTPPTLEESKNVQADTRLGKDQNHLLGTPPTTLYAAEIQPGYLPLMPPPHPHHPYQENGSPAPPGSLSTTATGVSVSPANHFPLDDCSVPKSSASQRPVLYSAIGSLETCSAHSLKTMKRNNNAAKNVSEFSKFSRAHLIAPRLQQPYPPQQASITEERQRQPNNNNNEDSVVPVLMRGNGDPQVRLSLTSASQDKFGDRSSTAPDQVKNNHENSNQKIPLATTIDPVVQTIKTSPIHQAAFLESFRAVQKKVDERERKRSPNSQLLQIQSSDKDIPSNSKLLSSNANQHSAARNSKHPKLESSMKKSKDGAMKKSVKIDSASLHAKQQQATKKPVMEMFRPSCDAYTPRMERKKITYKPAAQRTPVQKATNTMGTLQRPNFRDALRRVAMLIHQHIVKIERRFACTASNSSGGEPAKDDGLFKASMREAFSEEKFAIPRYKCTVVRVPMARPGMNFGLKKIRPRYKIPTEEEIYEFAHQLFKTVQLSSECSIVCLIYIERLMEISKVPLLADTWRPIFLCGLLLASKVWQDLSSWNIEFASVYPQFSLDSINKLEMQFLRMVKWDLYISSSLYAKYYFALRSLVEKQDFRQRYNRMVGGVDSVAASEALKIQKRTEQIKEEALMQLSRSM